jgi:hypothetical protein
VETGYHGEPVIAGLIDLEFARFADPYSERLFVTQDLENEPEPGFEEFLGAYGAGELGANAKVRSFIYQLGALAWETSDAIRRNKRDEAMEELDKMRNRLEEDKHIW